MRLFRVSEIASSRLAGGLLALAALLYLRRYMGINHDAALYLGQALLERWPAIFRQDLFFVHGSQASFTVMPWLVSQAFSLASPGTVFLLGSLLGLLAFAAACWFFLSSILPAGQRYWALLGAICLPPAYGMVRIFSYAEPFLTSRPLSEAACLLSLGFLSRSRLRLAFLALLVAGLLHPLQAIATCLIAWPWLVIGSRRWLHALWLAVPLAGLGFTDIPPFRDMFHPIDPAWLLDLREFTSQLFVSAWNAADFHVLCFDALVLGIAWRSLPLAFGRWCLAGLVGLVLGMAATLIFSDWLHWSLPTALQFWRVHWVAHVLALAGVGALLWCDVAARDYARALTLGFSLVLAQSFSLLWPVLALLYFAWARLPGGNSEFLRRAIGLLSLAGMLLLLVSYAANEWLPFRMAHFRLELYAFDRKLLVFPLLALGIPLAAAWSWQRAGLRTQTAMLLLALCPLVALGAIRWDARPPIVLDIERHPFRPDLFGLTLPQDAQVFWVEDLYPSVWLVLHRAEYFSRRQLAGLVFNRATAVDARQRLDRVLLVMREDLYCQRQPLEMRESCQLDDEAMRSACQPGRTRAPDFMVLPYHQPQRASGQWSFIDPATGKPALTYWLYSCVDVMRDLSPPNTGASS